MNLSPRERVQAAFSFERTDIVPYWIPMEGEVAEQLDADPEGRVLRRRIVNHLFGWHGVGDHGKKDLGSGCALSPWGYVTRDPLDHLEKPAFARPTLDGYRWPDPEALGDWQWYRDTFARETVPFRLCGMGYGFVERGSLMRGIENFLMDMIEHPQFVHDFCDGYLKIRLKLIDLIVDRIPVEGIFDGGDDCDQRGPMMGLPLWQEFIKPRLKSVVDHVHAKGLPVVAHMCGNVRPLIDDLLEIRLDALESLQPEAMDVYELKRKAAGKMVLIGGLGTQRMLPFGTPEEIEAETRRLKRELGAGGGFVLGPAKPLMADVPVENAKAFIRAAVGQ
jgi:uroporphyrinogen decarboxylase